MTEKETKTSDENLDPVYISNQQFDRAAVYIKKLKSLLAYRGAGP
jgi:hypothetical protein